MFVPDFARWPEFCSRLAAFAELLSEGIRFLRTIARSRTALGAEVLFLRKQLAYYQEREIRPRRLTDAARLSLVFWSRFFDWKESLAIVTTETFIRWHRKGFQFNWRWKSRGGRPALPKEIRQLITRMVKENITWGEERIADELSLKLGIYVSPRTVRCPANRANQRTSAISTAKSPFIFPGSRVLTNPSCGSFQSFWSVWTVASRNLQFPKANYDSYWEAMPLRHNLPREIGRIH
jgi:hypothetical protein